MLNKNYIRVNDEGIVVEIHYCPQIMISNTGLPVEHYEEKGYFVDKWEEPIISSNQYFIMKYNTSKNEVYFEIYDKTKTEEELKDEELQNKISILEAENADLLLDSAIKDSKIQTLENDLADLTLEIAMMEVR